VNESEALYLLTLCSDNVAYVSVNDGFNRSRSVSLIVQINHNFKQYIPTFSAFSMTYVLIYARLVMIWHTEYWLGIKFTVSFFLPDIR